MRTLLRNRKAAVGLMILAVFFVLAILGSLVFPDPTVATGSRHESPSAEHWLGTTAQGQDVLAQTIAGTRLSLAIGFVVGAAALLISVLVGVTAGYFGGLVDDTLSLLTNVFLVIPGMPLAIVMASFLPPGPVAISIVLVVTGWSWNARVLRSQTMALRGKDYVAAARVMGESPLRIIWNEILPNMRSLLGSCFIGATVYAIGAQVGLEFLGLGDPGLVSWGTNLYWATNDSALLTGAWWTFLPSGLCLALVAYALTLVNFGIDEMTNPRLEAERRFVRIFGPGPLLGRVARSGEPS